VHVPNHALGARVSAALVGAVTILSVAACSSSSTGSTASPVSTASSPAGTTQTVATSACGTKPGVKATGTPIPLGGIDTDQPGASFTDIGNMAAAYFACVNANGGINGHPISYTLLTEQTNPSQRTFRGLMSCSPLGLG
jgi:branched-chain amino acid transport system substrate-binding protein